MSTECPEPENLPCLYTCEDCMARIFSQEGLCLRVDDGLDSSVQDQMLEDVIMDATDTINQYCLPIYPETELAKSRWVARRAAYLACHFLSERRGNPSQYQARADKIETELERVLETNLLIPRLHTRNEITPAMSNLIVDDRYCDAFEGKLRVQRGSMVGQEYPEQHLDHPRGGCGCGYL